MAMDAGLKAKWVAALRSGEFKQGQLKFEDNGAYCCLGVLCVVAGEPPVNMGTGNWTFAHNVLPAEIPHFLARMNDGGKSFAEIADYIEANL